MDNRFRFTCRVCLVNDSTSFMRPLSDQRTREMLFECTSVWVAPNDKNPQQLCPKCWNRCRSWSDFKALAKDSDRQLGSASKNNVDNEVMGAEDNLMDEVEELHDRYDPLTVKVEHVVLEGRSLPTENEMDNPTQFSQDPETPSNFKGLEDKLRAVLTEQQRTGKQLDFLYKKFIVHGGSESVRTKFPIKSFEDWDAVIALIDREDPDSPILTSMANNFVKNAETTAEKTAKLKCIFAPKLLISGTNWTGRGGKRALGSDKLVNFIATSWNLEPALLTEIFSLVIARTRNAVKMKRVRAAKRGE